MNNEAAEASTFSWSDANYHNQPSTPVTEANTRYDVENGLVIETVTVITTTVTTTITTTVSSLDELRRNLFDRNIDQIAESLKSVIAPATLRAVLERQLPHFPPMRKEDPDDDYQDATRVGVFLSDENFCDWAIDRLMREYWRFKLLEAHSHDLTKALSSKALRDNTELWTTFTTTFVDLPEFRAIVDRPELTRESVKAEVLALAKKFLNNAIRQQRFEDSMFLSLDMTLINDEGENFSVENAYGLSSDFEGRTVVQDQGQYRNSRRVWIGYANDAKHFSTDKVYRKGARASVGGMNYVSLTDANQGNYPDRSDAWEIETDSPPLPTPKHLRKLRRKGRFTPTPQWLQCDRYLSVMLKNNPMRLADILRACENPMGTGQTFGRDRVKSSLSRVAYRVDGRYYLTIESMLMAQTILKDTDADGSEAEAERQARLDSWRVWPDGKVRGRGAKFNFKFAENAGWDAAEDFTPGPRGNRTTEPDVDPAELKSLYRKATLLIHPDRFAATETSEQIEVRTQVMVLLNKAYEACDLGQVKSLYKSFLDASEAGS